MNERTGELTEEQRVNAWRVECLLDYYELEFAVKLAKSDVDLHKACMMGKNGCTGELALEILL